MLRLFEKESAIIVATTSLDVMARKNLASRMMSESDASERSLVIEAGRSETRYWADLWTYRELFFILAWRDVSVRYKQTAVGAAWAIIRPFMTMVVFTAIFGSVAKLPTEAGAPYPILVFSGLLPWFLFSSVLSEASGSLLTNANLISKVYFPRIIVPTSAAVVALIDFLINLVILLGMMVWLQFWPTWRLLLLPAFVLVAVFASLGPALLFAALNVTYRDFRYVVPFVVQFGLYISPVGFSSSVIPESWRLIYSLNPIVGVIDGFRWCVLGGATDLNWAALSVSAVSSVALAATGVWYFRKTEKSFADRI
jgi:lipopolysaccharide transport system permease protein